MERRLNSIFRTYLSARLEAPIGAAMDFFKCGARYIQAGTGRMAEVKRNSDRVV
jgi:hypothetical protein